VKRERLRKSDGSQNETGRRKRAFSEEVSTKRKLMRVHLTEKRKREETQVPKKKDCEGEERLECHNQPGGKSNMWKSDKGSSRTRKRA